jgi:hypothetical protein
MAIKIIPEPDIRVTAGELERFRREYDKAFAFYAGPRPTLEEYIRREKSIPDRARST